MNQESVTEKIKKLLRMKRGGTPGEVENALRMASELARKHGIDLSAVDPDAPEAKPLSESDAIRSSRLQDEYKYAALVCQNFFNVTALITDTPARTCFRWRDYKIVFVGTDSDRAIAIYIFNFLGRHFRYCWNHRQNRRLRDRRSFMHGIFIGLCNKLESQRQTEITGEGLIRLDQQVARRKQYMQDHFGTGTTTKMEANDSTAARYAGYCAGQKTQIKPAVERPETTARQALPPTSGQMQLI